MTVLTEDKLNLMLADAGLMDNEDIAVIQTGGGNVTAGDPSYLVAVMNDDKDDVTALALLDKLTDLFRQVDQVEVNKTIWGHFEAQEAAGF